jgi:hypothetical protein
MVIDFLYLVKQAKKWWEKLLKNKDSPIRISKEEFQDADDLRKRGRFYLVLFH